jgi:hypothetical protein
MKGTKMNFLRNLFKKKQPAAGTNITLWVKDEATAKQLTTDQFFLLGVLMGDGSNASKNFQEALGKGGSLLHKVSRNSTKGGYNVELTVTPPAQR